MNFPNLFFEEYYKEHQFEKIKPYRLNSKLLIDILPKNPINFYIPKPPTTQTSSQANQSQSSTRISFVENALHLKKDTHHYPNL